jgi:cellulose synthase (UDP-forming)
MPPIFQKHVEDDYAPARGTKHPGDRSPSQYHREIWITVAALALSLAAWAMATWDMGEILWQRIEQRSLAQAHEQALFILIIQALLYGAFVYQFTRLGYSLRRLAHARAPEKELERVYDGDTLSLAILVPSYKEELTVVRRTLLSAMLQDFPSRRVVLLLDDPPRPVDIAEQQALLAIRRLPAQLQEMFEAAAKPLKRAYADFTLRQSQGILDPDQEAARLAALYDRAAAWPEMQGLCYPDADHGDAVLLDKVLRPLGRRHRDRARELRALSEQAGATIERVRREYRRLAALFDVEVTSFERKRYVNLSHEPNKAMNLNSYIGLLGKRWREVIRHDGIYLEPASIKTATLHVPAGDLLITLDADSILLPEYALVLVHQMLRPGGERIAVAQTPYNTIPNPPGLLERVAGATTDIQYLIHQGFTYYGGTYWVGANALLRSAALQDIRIEIKERGFRLPVFIQNRTVIEDTESSIDLVARGWSLYNYPERLAYSATPPDFGSLLIQRRRWANGGLIILPKLLRYLAARPWKHSRIREGFFRTHYLVSLAAANLGLLILLGFSFESSTATVWIPLSGLSYFFLYARDLKYSGYHLADLFRVYAFNLLLIPINLGGVFKSLQQAITGKRTPFGRTPKVTGRTSAPALYVFAEYGLLVWWLAGSVLAIADHDWRSASFCLANSIALGYAIHRFIGLRESWHDIRAGLLARSKPNAEAIGHILQPATSGKFATDRPAAFASHNRVRHPEVAEREVPALAAHAVADN